MPRRPREFHEGLYHVTAHGSDSRYIFLGTRSRSSFLKRLAEVCRRFELRLVSFALLGSHYHAIFVIRDARLSDALQRLHTAHSRELNRVLNRTAHLFRAHCKAVRIESDEQLQNALRYVALNPVEAGLVDDPLAWPWSSARVHAGLAPAPIPLDETPIFRLFDRDPKWRLHYRRLIEQARRNEVSDTDV
jgi:putative transposase